MNVKAADRAKNPTRNEGMRAGLPVGSSRETAKMPTIPEGSRSPSIQDKNMLLKLNGCSDAWKKLISSSKDLYTSVIRECSLRRKQYASIVQEYNAALMKGTSSPEYQNFFDSEPALCRDKTYDGSSCSPKLVLCKLWEKKASERTFELKGLRLPKEEWHSMDEGSCQAILQGMFASIRDNVKTDKRTGKCLQAVNPGSIKIISYKKYTEHGSVVKTVATCSAGVPSDFSIQFTVDVWGAASSSPPTTALHNDVEKGVQSEFAKIQSCPELTIVLTCNNPSGHGFFGDGISDLKVCKMVCRPSAVPDGSRLEDTFTTCEELKSQNDANNDKRPRRRLVEKAHRQTTAIVWKHSGGVSRPSPHNYMKRILQIQMGVMHMCLDDMGDSPGGSGAADGPFLKIKVESCRYKFIWARNEKRSFGTLSAILHAVLIDPSKPRHQRIVRDRRFMLRTMHLLQGSGDVIEHTHHKKTKQTEVQPIQHLGIPNDSTGVQQPVFAPIPAPVPIAGTMIHTGGALMFQPASPPAQQQQQHQQHPLASPANVYGMQPLIASCHAAYDPLSLAAVPATSGILHTAAAMPRMRRGVLRIPHNIVRRSYTKRKTKSKRHRKGKKQSRKGTEFIVTKDFLHKHAANVSKRLFPKHMQAGPAASKLSHTHHASGPPVQRREGRHEVMHDAVKRSATKIFDNKHLRMSGKLAAKIKMVENAVLLHMHRLATIPLSKLGNQRYAKLLKNARASEEKRQGIFPDEDEPAGMDHPVKPIGIMHEYEEDEEYRAGRRHHDDEMHVDREGTTTAPAREGAGGDGQQQQQSNNEGKAGELPGTPVKRAASPKKETGDLNKRFRWGKTTSWTPPTYKAQMLMWKPCMSPCQSAHHAMHAALSISPNGNPRDACSALLAAAMS